MGKKSQSDFFCPKKTLLFLLPNLKYFSEKKLEKYLEIEIPWTKISVQYYFIICEGRYKYNTAGQMSF